MRGLEERLRRAEHRLSDWIAGVHRFSDDELNNLIAWLREPDPEREEWAVALLRRERQIP